MKKKIKYSQSSKERRNSLYNFYSNKFLNMFINKYEWGGLTPEERDFIMKSYYNKGCISAINNKTIGLIYVNFAPYMFNIYNYPVSAMPIKTQTMNGTLGNLIPDKNLKVDEEIVISYIQNTRQSIFNIIDPLINKLVDVEMTINTNVKTAKMPFFVGVSPEDSERMQALIDAIMSDEIAVYGDFKDLQSLKSVVTNTPYIIDKLYAYKCSLENEILTFLGVNNMGVLEKKEHMITDEMHQNDETIKTHDDIFLINMQDFCNKCNEIFGSNISVKNRYENMEESIEENEEESEVEENASNN